MMLEGQVALVTGAGRGIGRAIATALASEGATVIVNYNGSEARAREVVAQIEENGGKAEAFQCDVTDHSASKAMIEDVIGRFGHLDILVNNAGITRDNLLMKMSEEDFDAVIDTNLKGAFNCIKHVSRQMIKQKGGAHHQHLFCIRCDGECGPGQLQRVEGRDHRPYEGGGQGAGQKRDHGERDRPRVHPDRDDGGPFGGGEDSGDRADPHEAFW